MDISENTANDAPQPEGMPYGMLGDDAMTDEQKIEKYTGDVDWSYLSPHQRAGVLFYVDPEKDLGEVARLFVKDDKDAVLALRKSGDLVLMDHLHAEWYAKNPQTFMAVVVAPFVLCQPLR